MGLTNLREALLRKNPVKYVALSPFDDPPPPKQGRGHLLTEKRVIETKPDLRNRETWGNLHFQHLQSGIKFFLLVVFLQ